MKVFTCVLVLLVPSLVFCEEGCFDRPPMQNFNFTLFQGEWNALMVNLVQKFNKCTQQIFKENGEDQNSTITFKFIDKKGDKDIAVTEDGPIWETTTPGKLQFILRDRIPVIAIPYWVLHTDYQNYAVIYICWLTDPIARDYVAVLGRSTSLSAEAKETVDAVVKRANPMPNVMIEVPHINCPPIELNHS